MVAPNIGPDKGHQTDYLIHGALARGVAADGRRLSPPMGARALIYSRITENDCATEVVSPRSSQTHRATSE